MEPSSNLWKIKPSSKVKYLTTRHFSISAMVTVEEELVEYAGVFIHYLTLGLHERGYGHASKTNLIYEFGEFVEKQDPSLSEFLAEICEEQGRCVPPEAYYRVALEEAMGAKQEAHKIRFVTDFEPSSTVEENLTQIEAAFGAYPPKHPMRTTYATHYGNRTYHAVGLLRKCILGGVVMIFSFWLLWG
jgi:hypothetical protein